MQVSTLLVAMQPGKTAIEAETKREKMKNCRVYILGGAFGVLQCGAMILEMRRRRHVILWRLQRPISDELMVNVASGCKRTSGACGFAAAATSCGVEWYSYYAICRSEMLRSTKAGG